MSWVKIDDSFPDHRKLAELGSYAPLCGWLYVCGLAFCNRQLTDGLIPKTHVRRLAGFEHLSIETGEIKGMASFGETVDPNEIADLLVHAGLWEDAGTHYRVHDYLHYQPSRESVLHERALAAERKERWKERQEERRRNGVRNTDGTAFGTARERRENKPPDPDPDPDPLDTKSVSGSRARRPQAAGVLSGSLPRDHVDHGFCGMRFCVKANHVNELVRRYGDGGAAFVPAWLARLDASLGGDDAAGDWLWVLRHFEADPAYISRLKAAAPTSSSTVPDADETRRRMREAAARAGQ